MADITIISVSPKDGATVVELETSIQIVTDTKLDPASVTYDNVIIVDTGNNILEGTLSYSNHNNSVYGNIGFSPNGRLKALETYSITLSGLIGTTGATLPSDITLTFTTGDIFSRSLVTPDKITFFEKLCYPQDGSNLEAWIKYNGDAILESRYKKRLVPEPV